MLWGGYLAELHSSDILFALLMPYDKSQVMRVVAVLINLDSYIFTWIAAWDTERERERDFVYVEETQVLNNCNRDKIVIELLIIVRKSSNRHDKIYPLCNPMHKQKQDWNSIPSYSSWIILVSRLIIIPSPQSHLNPGTLPSAY